MKRIIYALFSALYLVGITPLSAQQVYNSIATAYVTTTISQFVVFDSTMQQGGTFDFSVLAHNGGGRAGQSDTANVKIEFFTSGNALVTSANTSFSNNLPNPTALGGNPQIDPAVPWTTLAISKTLTQAQAATVAYANVSMYGIDGSYWAGDYGPWYRAPTLTVNGGGNNMLYNPEFGPYNNITAQGWTASPGFGACQGAWGGSNACIVNSSGQPGQSTVGLVANQNGGGPSATGGTTSGTAGGYNSTMSTNNPGGGTPAPAPTPAAPTVVSTTAGPSTSTSTSTPGQSTSTSSNTNGVTVNTAVATRGATVTTVAQADASNKGAKTIDVTRVITTTNTTPVTTVTTHTTPVTTVTVTTTPITTTTVTTPTIITTWSDGSTTTANDTPVTTTSVTNQVVTTTNVTNQVTQTSAVAYDVQSSSASRTKSVSATGISDVFKTSRSNPFIVDALSNKDGAWVVPGLYRNTTSGSMTGKTLSGGYQQTAENNSIGFAFNASNADSSGLINTRSSSESYSGVIYLLSKQEYVWLKATVGMGKDIVTTAASIPEFGISGISKAAQTNTYGDLTVYSAEDFWGFRPLVGATVVRSKVSNAWDSNALLPMTPAAKTTVQTNPYLGLRYEFNENISVEARTTQTKDFGNVKSIKATVKQEIFEDISVNASISYAKGNRYTNTTGMIGLDWKF
jgi:hypothetical protein